MFRMFQGVVSVYESKPELCPIAVLSPVMHPRRKGVPFSDFEKCCFKSCSVTRVKAAGEVQRGAVSYLYMLLQHSISSDFGQSILHQGPAGDGQFVTNKPVWARPTLASCNRLSSNSAATVKNFRVVAPAVHFFGQAPAVHFFGQLSLGFGYRSPNHDSADSGRVQPGCVAICPNGLTKRVFKYQTDSTVPACMTEMWPSLTSMIWLWRAGACSAPHERREARSRAAGRL
jgi:hypothetical protein